MSLNTKTPPNPTTSSYLLTPVPSSSTQGAVHTPLSVDQFVPLPGLEPSTTTPSIELSTSQSINLKSNSTQTIALSKLVELSTVSELESPVSETTGVDPPLSKDANTKLVNKARAALWLPRPAQPLPRPAGFQHQRSAIIRKDASHFIISPMEKKLNDKPLFYPSSTSSVHAPPPTNSHVAAPTVTSSELAPILDSKADIPKVKAINYNTNFQLPPASQAINLNTTSTPSDHDMQRLESIVHKWDQSTKTTTITDAKGETTIPDFENDNDITTIKTKWSQAITTIDALKQLLNKSKSLAAYYLLQNKLLRIEALEATRRHEVENKLVKREVNKLKKIKPTQFLVSAASLSKSALKKSKLKKQVESHNLKPSAVSTELPNPISLTTTTTTSSSSASSSKDPMMRLQNLPHRNYTAFTNITESRWKRYQRRYYDLTQEVREKKRVIATLEKKLDSITTETHQQRPATIPSPNIELSLRGYEKTAIDDEGMAALGLLACQEEVNQSRLSSPFELMNQSQKEKGKGKGKERLLMNEEDNNTDEDETNPNQNLLSPLILSSNPPIISNEPRSFTNNPMITNRSKPATLPHLKDYMEYSSKSLERKKQQPKRKVVASDLNIRNQRKRTRHNTE